MKQSAPRPSAGSAEPRRSPPRRVPAGPATARGANGAASPSLRAARPGTVHAGGAAVNTAPANGGNAPSGAPAAGGRNGKAAPARAKGGGARPRPPRSASRASVPPRKPPTEAEAARVGAARPGNASRARAAPPGRGAPLPVKAKQAQPAPRAVAATAAAADVQPRSLPRSWRYITLVPALLLTTALFLFLGWLQPIAKGADRLSLPEIFRIELTAAKAPPPPPARSEPEEEPKPRERPQSRPEEPSLVHRTEVRSVRPPARTHDRLPPELAPLQGIQLGIGGPGGGASLELPVGGLVEEVEQGVREIAHYYEQSRMIREASRSSWESRIGSAIQVAKPEATSLPQPRYPREAEMKGLEGYVVMNLLVAQDGKVADWEILQAVPPGVFETAIEQVLPRWQFAPALDSQGRPVEFWTKYAYRFHLRDARR